MKNTIFILFVVSLFSCSAQKARTDESIGIVNDFLTDQLKTDNYIPYKDLEIFVIEEAKKKTEALATYEFNYNNKSSWGKEIKDWALDSLQIQEWKSKLKNEKQYHWKTTDFKNLSVKILGVDSFNNTIRKGDYIIIKPRLIVFVSMPFIINDNNALISFASGNSQTGFGTIERFTVLMKKHNGKWIRETYFYDGQMD